jgi:hypothetical protein
MPNGRGPRAAENVEENCLSIAISEVIGSSPLSLSSPAQRAAGRCQVGIANACVGRGIRRVNQLGA